MRDRRGFWWDSKQFVQMKTEPDSKLRIGVGEEERDQCEGLVWTQSYNSIDFDWDGVEKSGNGYKTDVGTWLSIIFGRVRDGVLEAQNGSG
ncbi:hypothetical protein RJT34_03535 [Clitoria ternatea]|uniref:Uncharacterized protein n=1 Tax=Clitoria ternatea TaxID=43366 RepID=A0AAN9Q564_CLITE